MDLWSIWPLLTSHFEACWLRKPPGDLAGASGDLAGGTGGLAEASRGLIFGEQSHGGRVKTYGPMVHMASTNNLTL